MNPRIHPRKLVVIISEASIEDALGRDVMKLGAHGYTIADVRGRGRHGARDALWSADRSIRMEVLCDESTALTILEHVEREYFRNFAMVSFVADAGVLRPEKFTYDG